MRRGASPSTVPPTMKTVAAVAGSNPKIASTSSRVTQIPMYLPLISMASASRSR